MQHIAEHGLTVEDIEHALENYDDIDVSRSSDRPIAFGPTADGRDIAVVFDWIDEDAGVIYPITAYEV